MSGTILSRRVALTALVAAAAGACVPIDVVPLPGLPGLPGGGGGGGGGNDPVIGGPLQSGTYGGQWRDGTTLLETVTYGEGNIRVTRLAGGVGQGTSSLYRPIGGGRFVNPNGSTITVTSQQSFTWVNVNGENLVSYSRMN